MKRVFCDLRLCLGCKSCELACAVAHAKSAGLFASLGDKEAPRARVKVGEGERRPFPIRCHHCDDAPCITACMSAALSKDAKGRTVHDEKKCVGCWMCIMACPFGAVARDAEKKVVFKCDLCADRAGEVPACVEACPTKALFFGTAAEFKTRVNKKKGTRRELLHPGK